MEKMIFEAKVPKDELKAEDNGCAIIVEPDWQTQNTDDKIFVRIQSWGKAVRNKSIRII